MTGQNAPEPWVECAACIVDPVVATDITLLAVILIMALAMPRLAERGFAGFERGWSRLAERPLASIAFVGFLALGLRAAFLPWLGAPFAINHDENSLILQAQTFLAGRLTNPTPPYWEHFQEIHINVVPAYASMYFPGRGLPLALGLLIADNAWVGVWMSFIVMSMATVWMLRGWVSAPLALLGGVLVVLRLGLFSYWVNSYWSGAFTALGAMLIIGAFPRFLRGPKLIHGLLMGTGALILMINRPYEGLLLCLPLALALLFLLVRRNEFPLARTLMRVGLPAVAIVAIGGGIMLQYNRATTGDAWTTPYSANRQAYAITPAFLVASPVEGARRGPEYFRKFYDEWENKLYEDRHDPLKMIWSAFKKTLYVLNFFIGPLLVPAFLAGLWASRRDAILLGTSALFFGGFLIETWGYPHYAAPIFPVLLIFLMRGFAWLRDWRPAGRTSGMALTRFIPVAVLLALSTPVLSLTTGWPKVGSNMHNRACCTFFPPPVRAWVAQELRAHPGRDLVLVASGGKNRAPREPVVYNEPDIETADIVWAHRLGPAKDEALIRHFAGRKLWELDWRDDGVAELRPRPRDDSN